MSSSRLTWSNGVKEPPGKSQTGEMVSMPFYEVKYDFVLQKQEAALAAAE
jgi:hypothetical protein